ncbi:hypothetical protein [Fictibacillus phosphorivorans]|nr:hypothetical protein [Fictibacillus phosphorivorans]
MLNILRDFLLNNVLVPIFALAVAAIIISAIAKYGDVIFKFSIH